MQITIGFNKLAIAERISRDVARKFQVLAEKAPDFELLTITEADGVWVNDRVDKATKRLYPDLAPYATGLIYLEQRIEYSLTLADNFNILQEVPLNEAIYEIVSKIVVGEWFWEKGQPDIQKELLNEVAALIEEVKTILFQWRVERTDEVASIEESILVLGEDNKKYNYLVIGVPHGSVLVQVMEDINATLKSRVPGTLEYEKYKISDVHTPVLNKAAKRGLNTIADRGQAYVVMWKDDANETGVHEVISQLKGVDNTNEGEPPYFLIVFKMPENFNRASIRTIGETIKDSLVNKVMGQYFGEVGLSELFEFYTVKEGNSLQDMMSLLHRRTKPIRRGSNFFS